MRADDLETLEILKDDVFGTVAHCRLDGRDVICRDYSRAKGVLARPIARWLARREAAVLASLAKLESDRIPRLIHFGGGLCVRSFIPGQSLKSAPQADAAYYADGLRLLEHLHGAGVIHNDLEKPENWLVTPDGGAAIVDFQIAMRFADVRSRLFLLGAREDVRHLLKNKRRFCARGLTAEERAVVERRSGPARFNARFFKPFYRFVTRRLLGTSDRERSEGSR